MDADSAYAALRPFLADALHEAGAELLSLIHELEDGDPAALALLRSRVAIGADYGWNLYALDTAWSAPRQALERRQEAADLIVYCALALRLQNLAASRLLEAFCCDVDESAGAAELEAADPAKVERERDAPALGELELERRRALRDARREAS